MPWIRIDDHFDEHPKLAAAGPLGWAMWLAGLAYCNRNLTDGFIPWSIAGNLVSWDYLDATGPTRIYIGGPDSVSEEGAVSSEYVIVVLCNVGLWDKVTGGYRVHDFDQYQPTKAVIMAERAKKVAAGTAGGVATATARAQALATAPDVAQSKPVPKPVPVPVPVPVSNPVSPVSNPGARAKERTNGAPFTDPVLVAQRAAILAKYGEDQPIIAQPVVIPTPAAQEREAHRLEALALHGRFLDNELSEPEYQRLLADIGKPDDDLTRMGA